MGSSSSSGSSFLPKNPSQWGGKTLREFKDRNLLAFYRILFSTEWINRKTLLTLDHSMKIQEPVGKLDHSLVSRHNLQSSPLQLLVYNSALSPVSIGLTVCVSDSMLRIWMS